MVAPGIGSAPSPCLVREARSVPLLTQRRARRTLGVESVSQTYVVIDYRPQFDASPNVDVHVANAFGESGYLATTLDGSVERAYPYEP